MHAASSNRSEVVRLRRTGLSIREDRRPNEDRRWDGGSSHPVSPLAELHCFRCQALKIRERAEGVTPMSHGIDQKAQHNKERGENHDPECSLRPEGILQFAPDRVRPHVLSFLFDKSEEGV